MSEQFVLPTGDELKTWVASQPEGSVVGFCQSSSSCMLAQYLKEKYPQYDFLINFQPPDTRYTQGKVWLTYWPENASPDDEGKDLSIEAPDLSTILDRFDSIAGWDTPITREQALSCFDEVDRGGV